MEPVNQTTSSQTLASVSLPPFTSTPHTSVITLTARRVSQSERKYEFVCVYSSQQCTSLAGMQHLRAVIYKCHSMPNTYIVCWLELWCSWEVLLAAMFQPNANRCKTFTISSSSVANLQILIQYRPYEVLLPSLDQLCSHSHETNSTKDLKVSREFQGN